LIASSLVSKQIVEHSSDNETVLGSSRKLGGAVGHLIDGSEKRNCRLSFEFWSPQVIERRSNITRTLSIQYNIFRCADNSKLASDVVGTKREPFTLYPY